MKPRMTDQQVSPACDCKERQIAFPPGGVYFGPCLDGHMHLIDCPVPIAAGMNTREGDENARRRRAEYEREGIAVPYARTLGPQSPSTAFEGIVPTLFADLPSDLVELADEARRGLASLIPPIELPPLPEPMVRAPAPGTRTPQPLCGWCLVPPGQPPSFPVRWWYECDCKIGPPGASRRLHTVVPELTRELCDGCQTWFYRPAAGVVRSPVGSLTAETVERRERPPVLHTPEPRILASMPGAGGYGRAMDIMTRVGECSLCRETVPCVGIDNSDGEYAAGYLCLACVSFALGGVAVGSEATAAAGGVAVASEATAAAGNERGTPIDGGAFIRFDAALSRQRAVLSRTQLHDPAKSDASDVTRRYETSVATEKRLRALGTEDGDAEADRQREARHVTRLEERIRELEAAASSPVMVAGAVLSHTSTGQAKRWGELLADAVSSMQSVPALVTLHTELEAAAAEPATSAAACSHGGTCTGGECSCRCAHCVARARTASPSTSWAGCGVRRPPARPPLRTTRGIELEADLRRMMREWLDEVDEAPPAEDTRAELRKRLEPNTKTAHEGRIVDDPSGSRESECDCSTCPLEHPHDWLGRELGTAWPDPLLVLFHARWASDKESPWYSEDDWRRLEALVQRFVTLVARTGAS